MPSCLRSALAVLLFLGLAHLSSGQTSNTAVSDTGSVPVLNRVTFRGNVFDETARTEHWVVFFCVDWYKPCQHLRPSYLALASDWERELNKNQLLQLSVRFAEVDCAVDKVLCNDQLVEMYPALVHYHRGKRVGYWENGGGKVEKEDKKMHDWIENEMSFSMVEVQQDLIGSNETKDVHQHPLATAIRFAPLAAAIVGMMVWIFTVGAEVVRGFQDLSSKSVLRLRRASSTSWAEDLKKPALRQQKTPESLRQRLPESWARERQRIEL